MGECAKKSFLSKFWIFDKKIRLEIYETFLSISNSQYYAILDSPQANLIKNLLICLAIENEQSHTNKIIDLLINLLNQHCDFSKIHLLLNFVVEEERILSLEEDFKKNGIVFNEIKYFNFLNNCCFILHELSENK